LWWVESRVAVGLEILVEVFLEGLFERHDWCMLTLVEASKLEEIEGRLGSRNTSSVSMCVVWSSKSRKQKKGEGSKLERVLEERQSR